MIQRLISILFVFATLFNPFSPVQATAPQGPAPHYSISGMASLQSGLGLEGVRISVQDDSALFAISDADGHYAFPSVPEGLHTLKISCEICTGYKFSPEDRQIDLSADTDNVNYLAMPGDTQTFTIQGTVTSPGTGNLEGVNVTYGPGLWVMTGVDGSYTIPNLPPGAYTLSAARTGYLFFPSEYTIASLSADLTGCDFNGYDAVGAPLFSIAGRVTEVGVGLGGVRITYGLDQSVSTQEDGTYQITNLPANTYTLTPDKPEYTFLADHRDVIINESTTGIDFTAIRNVYSIRGKVALGGAGLSGVKIDYSGTSTDFVYTGSDGTYIIPDLPNGTYTLTPSLAEYTFSVAQDVNVGPDQTGIDFTATRNLYSIRGKVTQDGTGLSGVMISYTGDGTGEVATGPDGTYMISNLLNGTYTLTPSLVEYAFSTAQEVSVGGSKTGIDFTATLNTYSIQGFIRTKSGIGYKGITVEAIQGDSLVQSGITGDNGAYTINGLTKGTYIIQPTLPGAKFRVSDTDLSSHRDVSVGPNQTGIDFVIEFPVYIPAVLKDYDPLVIYAADFTTDLGWEPLYLGSGTAGVQSGAYVLKQTDTYKFAGSLSPYLPANLPDNGYDLRVKMNRVGSGDPSFGVMFDWKANSDFFLFQIDSDGQIYYIDHNGTVIANYDFSNKIKTGEQINELRVVRHRTSVDFYINGFSVLANVSAPDLAVAGAKGRLGLQLSTYSTAAEIHFTSFVIRRLP